MMPVIGSGTKAYGLQKGGLDMIRAMIIGTVSLVLAAITPVFVLQPIPTQNPDDRLLIIETTEDDKSSCSDIRVYSSGQILSVPLEEYLVGVLINEMPAAVIPSRGTESAGCGSKTVCIKADYGWKTRFV